MSGQINTDYFKSFINNQNTAKKDAVTPSSAPSSLEKTPNQDTFIKQNSEFKLDKKDAILIGTSAVAFLGAIFAMTKNHKLTNELLSSKNTLGNLENKLSAFQQSNQGYEKEIKKQKALVEQLTKALEDIKASNESDPQKQEAIIQKKLQELEKTVQEYVAPKAPQNEISLFRKFKYNTAFALNEIMPFKSQKAGENIDIKSLTDDFFKNGNLTIQLPKGNNGNVQDIQTAFIKKENMGELGVLKDSDMMLSYGQKSKWSLEKIARDIFQNFYDGNNGTLDGVKMTLQKQENGKTKIKIAGDSTYHFDNLRNIGQTTKDDNPYAAGGFGEGAKVLVNNLIHDKYTDKVTFASGDWSLDFLAHDKKLARILNQNETPIKGNFVEFETDNENLIKTIIKSLNFFEHSKNPDFQNLTFNSKDFGFGFLPDEKGNLYLTQRFEVGQSGKWDNSLDDLNLIFRRKPDSQKYRQITGRAFEYNRDRTALSLDEIENLTHYFTSDKEQISDEDLVKILLSTKEKWQELYSAKPNPFKSFINGVIKSLKDRKVGIDIKDAKYAAIDSYSKGEVITDTLSEYDFILLPEEFKEIGFPTGADIFKSLSAHKALEATSDEIKKIEILNQAVDAICDNIQDIWFKKAKEINFNFEPKDGLIKNSTFIPYFLYDRCKEDINEFLIKNDLKHSFEFSSYLRNNATKKEVEEFYKIFNDKINKMFHDAKKEDTKELQKIAKELYSSLILADNPIDIRTQDKLRTLFDLSIIQKEDAQKPKYIFDRHSEIAQNTLGESIVQSEEYKGHWIDREYLNTSSFNTLLGTWIHEITHKCGGDGTSEFTYALTDIIRVLTQIESSKKQLSLFEKVFNRIE